MSSRWLEPLLLLVLNSLLRRNFSDPPFLDFPLGVFSPSPPPEHRAAPSTTRGEGARPPAPASTPSFGVVARLWG